MPNLMLSSISESNKTATDKSPNLVYSAFLDVLQTWQYDFMTLTFILPSTDFLFFYVNISI